MKENKQTPESPDIFRVGQPFEYVADAIADVKVSKAWEDSSGNRFIEGYASTKVVDSYNDIVEPTAFESTKDEFFKYGGPLMLGHGGWEGLSAIPIGQVLEEYWQIDNIGLRIRAQIANTSLGDDAWALIKMGVLKSFSIGFRIKKYEMDQENGIRTITDLRLYEISVVTVPANPETLFQVVGEKLAAPASAEFKSIIRNLGDNPGGHHHEPPKKERKPMGDTVEKTQLAKTVDGLIERTDTRLDDIDSRVKDIEALKGEIAEKMTTLQEKQDQFAKGQITEADLKSLTDRINTDLKANIGQLQEQITQTKNMAEMARRRITVPGRMTEWRRFLPENRGRGDIDMILHTSVDREKGDGPIVGAIQELQDERMFLRAVAQKRDSFQKGDEVAKKLEEVDKSMVELLKFYDSNISEEEIKAFSSSTSSYGSDWAFTVPSAEMFDLYDLNLGVEGEFRHVPIRGKAQSYPALTGHGHAYSADAATTNYPDRYKATDITTSSITFTAKKTVYRIHVDEESIEGDSFVDIIPLLRREIAWSLQNGVEDAIINGDSDGTHQDTGLTSATMYNRDRFDGLRKKAMGDSKTLDTTSTSTGVGDAAATFGAGDVRYLRQLMAKHGTQPSLIRYLVPIEVYFKILNMAQFSQQGTYGAGASWLTGYLNNIDGCPLIITENMWSNLNASGIYDNSTTTYTAMLAFNVNAFIVGDRKLIAIEFEKDIATGQWHFVGSVRKDFQYVFPSGDYGVSYAYKITT